jgi:hypothetical protein
MSVWWSYLWPVLVMGFVVGAAAGSIAYRVRILPPIDHTSREKRLVPQNSRKRMLALASGLAVALALAALWHGPLGAANRLSVQVERSARQALDHFEMYKVSAHLHHGPLTRRLILAGPADDFQSSELVRIMSATPGASGAQWSDDRAGLPLILEGAGAAVLGFLFGLLLAYLVELRRRHNAQWDW